MTETETETATTTTTEDRSAGPCPCGSGTLTADCCARYIGGGQPAPTAEALMRSRYTAYVLGQIDWIVDSHDPKSAEEVDRKSTEQWSKEAKWLGLEIKAKEAGGASDDKGMVEFVARYEVKGNPFSHHERATFRREGDRWYYMDGEMVKPKPVVRDQPKVGRNDPCPCGSGNKYKKCHGAAA